MTERQLIIIMTLCCLVGVWVLWPDEPRRIFGLPDNQIANLPAQQSEQTAVDNKESATVQPESSPAKGQLSKQQPVTEPEDEAESSS
jgi:hypothetical protein